MGYGVNFQDINKQKGLPRTYRFNQIIRWFTLLLGLLAIAYSIWVIFTRLQSDSPGFYKIVPFIIMFLAANSVLKNLFSLNKIIFRSEDITFCFLARRSVRIPWLQIRRLTYGRGRQKFINIFYEVNGEEKRFLMTLAFPRMLEIINGIAELVENVEYDEFLQKIIISDQEKKQTEPGIQE